MTTSGSNFTEDENEQKLSDKLEPVFLSQLPHQVLLLFLTILWPMLSKPDQTRLTQTAYTLHRDLLRFFPSARFEHIHKELSQHVIQSQKNEAEKILISEESSDIARYSGQVQKQIKDGTVQTFEGPVYRIALGAEDDEMAAMIQSHLLKYENGESQIKKQQEKQYPEGYVPGETEKTDFFVLDKLFKIICHSTATDGDALEKECKPSLEALKKQLNPGHVIESGKHFNIHLYLRALELCLETASSNNSMKIDFSVKKVAGLIYSYMPAHYTKIHGIAPVDLNSKCLTQLRTAIAEKQQRLLEVIQRGEALAPKQTPRL